MHNLVITNSLVTASLSLHLCSLVTVHHDICASSSSFFLRSAPSISSPFSLSAVVAVLLVLALFSFVIRAVPFVTFAVVCSVHLSRRPRPSHLSYTMPSILSQHLQLCASSIIIVVIVRLVCPTSRRQYRQSSWC